jgi:hypothetical protein
MFIVPAVSVSVRVVIAAVFAASPVVISHTPPVPLKVMFDLPRQIPFPVLLDVPTQSIVFPVLVELNVTAPEYVQEPPPKKLPLIASVDVPAMVPPQLVHFKSRQVAAAAIVTVAVPELASKNTLSLAVGTVVVVEPPLDVLQLAAVAQLAFPALTQYLLAIYYACVVTAITSQNTSSEL